MKIKKIIIAVLLSSMMLTFSACGKVIPEGMSEELYDYGVKALDIMDKYNDKEISEYDANSELTTLREKIDNLDDDTSAKALEIITSIDTFQVGLRGFTSLNTSDAADDLRKKLELDVTASPTEATTENIYDLNYNLQIDDYVSCKVNEKWSVKVKDDRIYSFNISDKENIVLAKAKDSDVVTDASLIDYLKSKKEDYTFRNIGGQNAILVTNGTEDKYYLNTNGNTYEFILSAGIPEDAKSAILGSINVAIVKNTEKTTEELAEKPTEKVTKKATKKVTEEPTEKPTSVPKEYQNALKKAKVYSDTMYMSKSGVYNQLTSEYGEGFSEDAANYAIENLDADYKANALAKAKTYQETMAMSKSAIYDQLVSEYGEGFTEEEAQYAIDNLED